MDFGEIVAGLRGAVRDCLPYGAVRFLVEKKYGWFYPDLVTRYGFAGFCQKYAYSLLPFGVVRRKKKLPAGRKARLLSRAPVKWPNTARYVFPKGRLALLRRDRAEGLEKYAPEIAANRNCSILVILHLFYDRAWPVIQEYLKNLAPYRVDWIFTVTEGCISDKTLAAVRRAYPQAEIVTCANRGFDLWPFVQVLNRIDLNRYDIIFKLHSKGVSRPFIFIYNQIFKYSDWFFNLYDGILGGRTVHRAINLLMSGRAQMTAARNLVVRDPKHKEALTQKICRERGLPFCEGYRFVAGTCFAARSGVLRPLQELALTEADFPPTVRGRFSLAHAIERWLCFAAAGNIRGIPVRRPVYRRELKARRAVSSLRLLKDERFVLDDEFFYHALEMRPIRNYEVVRLKLKDIRRRKLDGTICPLEECEPFRYLCGRKSEYDQYCEQNRLRTSYEMNRERFGRLIDSVSADYDPKRMPVVQGPQYIIRDGQHRCCILLKQYGPDHEIDVLHFW